MKIILVEKVLYLEAIYYGLGFEEIVGGKGEKVLTSVYKTYIEHDDKKLAVLESKYTYRYRMGMKWLLFIGLPKCRIEIASYFCLSCGDGQDWRSHID